MAQTAVLTDFGEKWFDALDQGIGLYRHTLSSLTHKASEVLSELPDGPATSVMAAWLPASETMLEAGFDVAERLVAMQRTWVKSVCDVTAPVAVTPPESTSAKPAPKPRPAARTQPAPKPAPTAPAQP